MNCIFVVNALLLLRLTGANLVGNFTANATVIIDSVDNVSSSDPVHPYCLNTVINSPSIFDLHTDLGTAIDMLELVCTNTTFKRNPPFRDVKLELDKNEHNQNDAINAALEYHMAVNSKMETICKDEEKKFYRGESSMIEKCNISCITANVERRIVLYLQANKCGCQNNGEINCHYLAKPRNEDIECMGNCDSLTMLTCQLWDSFNFMQQIFTQIWYLRRNAGSG